MEILKGILHSLQKKMDRMRCRCTCGPATKIKGLDIIDEEVGM
jgi:hypothetical protein